MKSETTGHLDRADDLLHRAKAISKLLTQAPALAEDTTRNAYYAAFHAAKAFIFERNGKTHKSHGGVHKEFAHLAKSEPSIDAALSTFLPAAYDYKRIGDYDIKAAGKITPADALLALKEAERFVTTIQALLP